MCVRNQPQFSILEESLVFGCLHYLFTFLIEDLAQVIYLEIIYFLVIYLIQCVQLSTCLLSLSTSLGILQLRESMEVDILRMNSEDADAAVWITVGPCMGDGGIIDRKEMEHLLDEVNITVNGNADTKTVGQIKDGVTGVFAQGAASPVMG